MKFTWSDQKSIILTRVVVAGTIAGCGIMTVSGPWLTRWMVSAHALPPASGPVLLGMGYVCAVLAFGPDGEKAKQRLSGPGKEVQNGRGWGPAAARDQCASRGNTGK